MLIKTSLNKGALTSAKNVKYIAIDLLPNVPFLNTGHVLTGTWHAL